MAIRNERLIAPHWKRRRPSATVLVLVAFRIFAITVAALEFVPRALGCNIKGNISHDTGERIYHLPSHWFYWETDVNWFRGERYFCSEKAAREAGWRKARLLETRPSSEMRCPLRTPPSLVPRALAAGNVAFLCALRDSGVKIVFADMPDANDLTINVLASVAQHEAALISQRTKAALAATAGQASQRSAVHDRGGPQQAPWRLLRSTGLAC